VQILSLRKVIVGKVDIEIASMMIEQFAPTRLQDMMRLILLSK
jgi:hypothetical protein